MNVSGLGSTILHPARRYLRAPPISLHLHEPPQAARVPFRGHAQGEAHLRHQRWSWLRAELSRISE